MIHQWYKSPAARFAALSLDHAPTAIIGCLHMTEPMRLITYDNAGTAHDPGSRKLSSPYRPIDPVGGNRPRVLTEGADGRFRSSGK